MICSILLSHFARYATPISLTCLLPTLVKGLIMHLNIITRMDIFYEALKCQPMELDYQFNDSSMELIHLSTTLEPKSTN